MALWDSGKKKFLMCVCVKRERERDELIWRESWVTHWFLPLEFSDDNLRSSDHSLCESKVTFIHLRTFQEMLERSTYIIFYINFFFFFF